ncbi:MAG: acyltransferase [Tepidisphaeraceae bacterium]|jgi:peptidoglycan/LPS O-acetylase OafA/YrhL
MGHVPALDGIRGLAILIVVIFHITPMGEDANHGVALLIARILNTGAMGVDLFFVLSGFLITGILLRSKSSPRYFLNFYGRRALRIFPLYYFVLTLVTIGLYTIPSWRPYNNLRSHWPSYWFYGTNFIVARHGWEILEAKSVGLGYLWSLAVEEHFYLFWPFMVWLFSERGLTRVCLAMMVTAPVLRGLSLFLGQEETASAVLTQCRMDSLATGALLSILVHYKSPAEVLRRFRWIGLISGVLFVAYNAIRVIHIPGFPLAPTRIFGNSILAFAFASLICLVLGGGWTTGLMSWRPLRLFGVYSYGIYIYHGILLGYLMTWFTAGRLSFNTGHLWLGVLPHYILCVAAPTLVAVLSYHLLEGPLLKLKRFF